MNSVEESLDKSDRMAAELSQIFDRHSVEYPKHDSFRFTTANFLLYLPDPVPLELAEELHRLANNWSVNGGVYVYEARCIYKGLGISDEEIYQIVKSNTGKKFGHDYEEFCLIDKYGTDDEVNTAMERCNVIRDFWSVSSRKIGSCIDEIRESLSALYSRDLNFYGTELCVPPDFIEQYDAIVGIANAGISVPLLSSSLSHPNCGIIEYHHRSKVTPLQWIVPLKKEETSRILICENDAVTGQTLQKVIPTVLRKCKTEKADILFTADIQHSQKVAKNVPGVGEAFEASQFPRKNVFQRMCDIRDRLRALAPEPSKTPQMAL